MFNCSTSLFASESNVLIGEFILTFILGKTVFLVSDCISFDDSMNECHDVLSFLLYSHLNMNGSAKQHYATNTKIVVLSNLLYPLCFVVFMFIIICY